MVIAVVILVGIFFLGVVSIRISKRYLNYYKILHV